MPLVTVNSMIRGNYSSIVPHYYALDEPGETGVETQKPPRYYGYFRKIPADLQNGPRTFSPDMKSMVATVIEYDKEKTTVEMANRKLRPFRTKLFYSVLKNKKKRFTKYVPAFPQEEMSSYAHPYLFNEGKSLLFTSDMPGGYGGFDLYVVHWDEEAQAWGLLLIWDRMSTRKAMRSFL